MDPDSDLFTSFKRLMQTEGVPEIAIRSFSYYYHQLLSESKGLIPESKISPVIELPDVNSIQPHTLQRGKKEIQRTVILKLNGGLGTSMGLNKAKSLLQIKDRYSFLDLMVLQAHAQETTLVLLNSFNTASETRKLLNQYRKSIEDLPWGFLQHKVPKINCNDLNPVSWPPNPQLEWCPPGHGDIYLSLMTSGMLDNLLDHGYRYVFISNGDNLGASLEAGILGYFVENNLSFLMEVTNRTQADRKGGQLVRDPQKGYLLREASQCPKEDLIAFMDIQRHKYFNTNNLWINLKSLRQKLEENNGILKLPIIINKKTVDPRDPASTPVYQLETAMGAAIGCFDNSGAIRVSRKRFIPVKTTNDLLLVRSDVFCLQDDFRIESHPTINQNLPRLMLDTNFYRTVDQLELFFPHGSPSLIQCKSLSVEGQVLFGKDIKVLGDVRITNRSNSTVKIRDYSILEGNYSF